MREIPEDREPLINFKFWNWETETYPSSYDSPMISQKFLVCVLLIS